MNHATVEVIEDYKSTFAVKANGKIETRTTSADSAAEYAARRSHDLEYENEKPKGRGSKSDGV